MAITLHIHITWFMSQASKFLPLHSTWFDIGFVQGDTESINVLPYIVPMSQCLVPGSLWLVQTCQLTPVERCKLEPKCKVIHLSQIHSSQHLAVGVICMKVLATMSLQDHYMHVNSYRCTTDFRN